MDMNPCKHGLVAIRVALTLFVTHELREIRPGLVLISNAHYELEIVVQVRSLCLEANFGAVAG